nr:MAG TPA: hypothetical protein [Caudoviricetes sp.]
MLALRHVWRVRGLKMRCAPLAPPLPRSVPPDSLSPPTFAP